MCLSFFRVHVQFVNCGRMMPRTNRVSVSNRQLEKVFHKRECCAVHAFDLRVRRFDNVIFVRSMSAAAMAKTKVAGGELQRRAGEHVARPGTCAARPEQGIDSMPPANRTLCANEYRVGWCRGWVVPAGHAHFDVS